jgi:glycogen(starch) synthase
VRSLGAKLLVTRHELFDRDHPVGPDTLAIRVMRQADWVACCCRAALAETRAHLPEITPRSSAILNGLPFPNGVPRPAPLDPPVLLCIGRLSEQKGFDLAVAAFSEVLTRFPAARLVILGDGPERAALEAQAARSGVAPSIEFVGWIPPSTVPEQIASSTIVLQPSRRVEGLPLVAVQAAQIGRPIVATRVGGLPEVVSDRETGFLVEPEDPRALARAIVALLDEPEALQRMGEAARRRARRDFTIDRFVSEYVDLYHRLVEEGRNAGIA